MPFDLSDHVNRSTWLAHFVGKRLQFPPPPLHQTSQAISLLPVPSGRDKLDGRYLPTDLPLVGEIERVQISEDIQRRTIETLCFYEAPSTNRHQQPPHLSELRITTSRSRFPMKEHKGKVNENIAIGTGFGSVREMCNTPETPNSDDTIPQTPGQGGVREIHSASTHSPASLSPLSQCSGGWRMERTTKL